MSTFRKGGKCSPRKHVQSHRKVTQQARFEEIEVIPSVFGVEAVRGLAISDTGEVGKGHVDHGGPPLVGLDVIMDEDVSRELEVALCSFQYNPSEGMWSEEGSALFPAGNLFPEYELNIESIQLKLP